MIGENFCSFFIDPILRAPTIGSMLMCLSAGLIGSLAFLKKRSLVGEVLSHTAYPGVIIGILIAGSLALEESHEMQLSFLILSGALCSSLIGLWTIHWLEKKTRTPTDAALCFVLSSFFGLGVTLVGEVQFSFTSLYKQATNYLYGQAATMTDVHIVIYATFALFVLTTIFLLYKELQTIIFDPSYAESQGIAVKKIETLLSVIFAVAVVIGIRSVGILLMSAMFVAPTVAARQLTHRFSYLLGFSAFFALLSGFFGNYLSVELTDYLQRLYPTLRLSLPTGPMIVLVATSFCLCTLLFAKDRGVIIRMYRIARFRFKCLYENVLKQMWRMGPEKVISFDDLVAYHAISPLYLKFLLWRMTKNGWIEKHSPESFCLTKDGCHVAVKIVRLHRLWEVYLAHHLGVRSEKVHTNAEEMEHILTPDLERELMQLLDNPTEDPHKQPIPSIPSL